jgi:H/ACA ribonucleoprotein complex subunit 3
MGNSILLEKGQENRLNRLLLKCKNCGTYTLANKCPKCGAKHTVSPHPPKFSLDDKYLRYRMKERYEEYKVTG